MKIVLFSLGVLAALAQGQSMPATSPAPGRATGSMPASATAPASLPAPARQKIATAEELSGVLNDAAAAGKIDATIVVSAKADRAQLTARATTLTLMRMLLALETSKQAVQIESMTVRTRTPGTDDLDVSLDLVANTPEALAGQGDALHQSYVQVMRDLTAAFPPQGNTIWATGLVVTRGNKWTLEGRCSNLAHADMLVAKLAQDERFKEPKLIPGTQLADGNFSFQVHFGYVAPAEGK